MQKKIRSIGLFALDVSSAIVLTLGIIFLLLPIILHLTLGADNDSYIEIGEWGGPGRNILGYLGLEWMFRIDFLLWPALLIIIGLGIRWLLRRVGAPPHAL
jgi:uncharacterized membrane protein YciS (DUF1049 family)